MQVVDVFCERCGTPQPKPEVAAPRSAGVLARRVLDAVGITENHPTPTEDWLRLCLSCRGYSCPACWNDVASTCQTCEPLPEPTVAVAPEPLPEPVVIEREPEPIPYWVSQLEPLVAPREREPVLASELEPVAAVEPEVPAESETELVDIVDRHPLFVADAEPEPMFAAQAEIEPKPDVAAPEPDAELVSAEAAPEPEPVIAEPEPEPVVVAEPEPEPEPEPVDRPRMPVLPLPPPRPADAPVIPLPPLPTYPVTPQISFNAQVSVAASSQTSAPAYEAHLLLAPPTPELSPNAVAAGLRLCPSCRLTLSARAHFCRRCGTAQAN